MAHWKKTYKSLEKEIPSYFKPEKIKLTKTKLKHIFNPASNILVNICRGRHPTEK